MHAFLREKLLIPVCHKIKNNPLFVYYKQLKQADNYSEALLLEVSWNRLKCLLHHCYDNVSYYQKIFKSKALYPFDIRNAKDYSLLPMIDQDRVNYLSTELTDKSLNNNSKDTYDVLTNPIIKEELDELKFKKALKYRGFSWCGWSPGVKTLEINIYEKSSFYFKLTSDFASNITIISASDVSEIVLKNCLKTISEKKPNYIIATDELLLALSNYIIEKNIDVENIMAIFCESSSQIEKNTIIKAFKAPVYLTLKLKNLPVVFQECKNGHYHINNDQVFVEFIDNDKELIITPLCNYTKPLLRYQTGLYLNFSNTQCNCNLPYQAINIHSVKTSKDAMLKSNNL